MFEKTYWSRQFQNFEFFKKKSILKWEEIKKYYKKGKKSSSSILFIYTSKESFKKDNVEQ
jgi:hypothetical protein